MKRDHTNLTIRPAEIHYAQIGHDNSQIEAGGRLAANISIRIIACHADEIDFTFDKCAPVMIGQEETVWVAD